MLNTIQLYGGLQQGPMFHDHRVAVYAANQLSQFIPFVPAANIANTNPLKTDHHWVAFYISTSGHDEYFDIYFIALCRVSYSFLKRNLFVLYPE